MNQAANTIQEFFTAQVKKQGDKVAYNYRNKNYTYKQLESWSNLIANKISLKPKSDTVMLILSNKILQAAAILAVLKVNMRYIPIDLGLPEYQIAEIERSVKISCIITDRDIALFSEKSIPVLDVSNILQTTKAIKLTKNIPFTDNEIFQLIYTSGTTGKPKGVNLSYSAVLNRLQALWHDNPHSLTDVFLVFKSYSLVASFWEMFGGLLQGNKSVLLTTTEVSDSEILIAAIRNHQITHAFLNPNLIANLTNEMVRTKTQLPSLRLLTNGADILTPSLTRITQTLLPQVIFKNLYGLTETASNIAEFDTKHFKEDSATVPVGKPIAHSKIIILDKNKNPIHNHEVGEIAVTGPCLAVNYENDEAMTAEKFINCNGEKHFITGDLGYYDLENNLVILGRKDNQVKLNGYTIHLEHIESYLSSINEIKQAGVALVHNDKSKTLGALVVTKKHISDKKIKLYLKDKLPSHMMPQLIIPVTSLPVVKNNKLDRPKLEKLLQNEIEKIVSNKAANNSLDEQIKHTWKTLLGTAITCGNENFFEMGGNSILAINMASTIESFVNKKVPLRLIFEHPTYSALLKAVGEL